MLSKMLGLLALSSQVIAISAPLNQDISPQKRYSSDPASSVFLPFETAAKYAHDDFKNDPYINYQFSWAGGNSAIAPVFVDTGSVGAVIGAHYFPGWLDHLREIEEAPAGHILYTSSGRLLTGHFMDVDFEFLNGSLPLKAHGPILVVNETLDCSNTTYLIDGHYCPPEYIKGNVTCTGRHCTNSYFGIGWARGTNPAANNPLLNIVSVNNNPISEDYTFGYTLTEDGLNIGLTEETTAGFSTVNLNRKTDAKFDWAQVQGCLETSAPGQTSPATCVPAIFLLDTGIDQGYATVTSDNKITGWHSCKGLDGTLHDCQNLPDGYTVTSRFGSGANPSSFAYSFTMGQAPLAPTYLSTTLNATGPDSLNTGRHFFRINDMMYDATNGIWGARYRYAEASSASSAIAVPTDARTASVDSPPPGAEITRTREGLPLSAGDPMSTKTAVSSQLTDTGAGSFAQGSSSVENLVGIAAAATTSPSTAGEGSVDEVYPGQAVQGQNGQSGADAGQSHEGC